MIAFYLFAILKLNFMKNKLFISGLVFISLLTYSCSNDDEFGMPESKNNNSKIKPEVNLKNELVPKRIDSTTVIFSKRNVIERDAIERNTIETNAREGNATEENGIELNMVPGDPSNPKPPRP